MYRKKIENVNAFEFCKDLEYLFKLNEEQIDVLVDIFDVPHVCNEQISKAKKYLMENLEVDEDRGDQIIRVAIFIGKYCPAGSIEILKETSKRYREDFDGLIDENKIKIQKIYFGLDKFRENIQRQNLEDCLGKVRELNTVCNIKPLFIDDEILEYNYSVSLLIRYESLSDVDNNIELVLSESDIDETIAKLQKARERIKKVKSMFLTDKMSSILEETAEKIKERKE